MLAITMGQIGSLDQQRGDGIQRVRRLLRGANPCLLQCQQRRLGAAPAPFLGVEVRGQFGGGAATEVELPDALTLAPGHVVEFHISARFPRHGWLPRWTTAPISRTCPGRSKTVTVTRPDR